MSPAPRRKRNTHPLDALTRKQWFLLASGAIIVLAAAISVSSTEENSATARVCTRVVIEDDNCSDGQWSPWTVVDTRVDEDGAEIRDERRVYNGTRTLRHVMHYVRGSGSCMDGFTERPFAETIRNDAGFLTGFARAERVYCAREETRSVAGDETLSTTKTDLGGTVPVSDVVELQSENDLNSYRSMLVDATVMAFERGDGRATVEWSSREADYCIVTGTNGDSWTGLSGVELSAEVDSEDVFVIECVTFDGTKIDAIASINALRTF